MATDARTADQLRAEVQGYYDTLDRNDMEAVLEYFSGDVLYLRPGYDRMVGIEALKRYYAEDRKIAGGRHVISNMIVEGQTVAAHGMWEGNLRDGTESSMGFAAFFEFDGNGRIREQTTYFFTPAV